MGQAVTLYNSDGNPISYYYPLDTQERFREDFLANLYLYRTDATPTITSNTELGDTTINIDSNSNISNGDAITFYEDIRVFQSLVVSTTATSVTIASPLDYAFTTSAILETGAWKCNVDGSTTEQIFSIKAPPNRDFIIKSVGGTMLSTSNMDDGLFGSLTQLSNGVIYRVVGCITTQYALIVNNVGFWENGFDIEYSAKAPAGSYGIKVRKSLMEVNGVVRRICNDTVYQLVIRDDLTGLDLFSFAALGHLVVKAD